MVERKGERVRLYVRGIILGYKRSKSNQYPSTSLIQIEGVNTAEDVNWYLGKRLAYVYKGKTKKNGSLFRCIWGKVARCHGNSGVVRAKFRKNLPPASLVSDFVALEVVMLFFAGLSVHHPLYVSLNVSTCAYFLCSKSVCNPFASSNISLIS
ncbi:hypothetical protein Mp_1g11470 [Marchantia polymorpha subsp. ruderalis]|uniref:Uncharacterized protein n=2 Tax=Marchantia polymorpha TaxID=3197 RepID=A0AAF6AP09_MARPO|nr:hypothetical protein MARPO_0014s0079 [Marchantia polymorpha]BBM98179.1 hypothetical protein Mp_1g11470 [Marchantia polymorpha subsp. ruderalis]|eukprot:PTQ45544.1 hypothetical protein MARPO_0014s0079 [Marchantia polymorpha]